MKQWNDLADYDDDFSSEWPRTATWNSVRYIIHNIIVGQNILLYDTNPFDYVYLLLLYMFYEAIFYRILLSSRSLGNSPSMICIYNYFEGV